MASDHTRGRTPGTRSATLSINGDEIGLYTLMEAPDQPYVFARGFPDIAMQDAHLFKVKSLALVDGIGCNALSCADNDAQISADTQGAVTSCSVGKGYGLCATTSDAHALFERICPVTCGVWCGSDTTTRSEAEQLAWLCANPGECDEWRAAGVNCKATYGDTCGTIWGDDPPAGYENSSSVIFRDACEAACKPYAFKRGEHRDKIPLLGKLDLSSF